MKNVAARLGLCAALAVGGLGLVPSSVGAVTPVQKCAKVVGSATLTPGLSATPHNNTIKAKATQSGCTPAAKTGGSGVLTATISVPNGSCVKLGSGNQTVKGSAATTWKNKKVSKYALTLKTGTGANITVATITGKVSSGLFAGKKVSGQIKFKPKAGQDCSAAHPIKNITFVQTKPFVIS